MDRNQVISLAPDAASVSAAQKLTSEKKWPMLAYNGHSIWGQCRGSGSKPYQTRIDRQDNAFKCNCPSRKFPCKHGLALFLLYVENSDVFSEVSEPPDWVAEWLQSRMEQKEKKQTRARNKKPVDPEAREKRRSQRQQKILDGVNDLALWLEDSVRLGIAELVNKDYRYWDDLAARMVDAQAPGLAAWIRRIGATAAGAGGDAVESIVDEFAKLFLLVKAYPRQQSLPSVLTDELRYLVGWHDTEAELLDKQAPLNDEWLVLGRKTSDDNQLLMQTVWLFGLQHQRFAKNIQFAHASQRTQITNNWAIGSVLLADLHFFPSAIPLRAAVGKYTIETDPGTSFDRIDFKADALKHYRTLLAENPWLSFYPLLMDAVTPQWQEKQLWFYKQSVKGTRRLAVNTSGIDVWKLIALSGGEPLALVAEWDGFCLHPIGVRAKQGYHSLILRAV